MVASLLLVLAAFGQVAAGSSPADLGADPSYDASIRAMNDQPVYAEAEGLLTKLNVRQGSRVKKGDVIGAIDDRHAQAAVDVAHFGYVAAAERAKDKIEEEYATLAAGVAGMDYKMSLEANRGKENVISLIDIEKKKLDWNRAQLQIEKAKKDRNLASLDADVKNAELRAARVGLERRTMLAPFDGEVQEMLLHEAEWVNPGDPVLQLVQFDVMWVECYVEADKYDPAELQGRPVTLRINLARNRQAAVEGRIVYVNQFVLETGGAFGAQGQLDAPATYGASYLVRAEVQNKREGDFWLVRPGMPANLTIHVNQPAVVTPPASASAAAQ